MKSTMPILAVDGGGTKSLAVVYQVEKGVLGMGLGGGSNIQITGIDDAMYSIEDALKKAGATKIKKFSCAAFAIAGVDTEKDEFVVTQMVRGVLKKLDLEVEKIIIKNDAVMTLLGTLQDEPGILVLAGTGSIVVASDGKGNLGRAGGWGHRLKDEGSACYLGKEALVAAFHSYDGRKNAEILLKSILKLLSLKDISELKEWIYNSSTTASDIATLAPLVLELAAKGDETCSDIVNRAIEELMLSVNTVYRKILAPIKKFTLVLQGGLFQHSLFYRQSFIKQFKSIYTDAEIKEPRYQPVVGAMYLALKSSGYNNYKMEELKNHPLLLLKNV
ncbi:BadF/BadG/BcrA/BcrD ATPase family protein [Thermoanaerobacter sp. A7A]|uniref:BadF/BadG/BcrA/BcrD ATPase family protein n=1 Tax=Thermoanaerobacter sp. A7A TaxID=1350366 RepID=UPI000400FF87|nr:BadF/BadG/BcrA/BcrD ATPase family protein [Thermoanaerobacter sp. A7A]